MSGARVARWLSVGLAIAVFACATKGSDGSTHFVECKTDAECAPTETCAEGKCVAAGVTTSDATASACPGVDTNTDIENCGACGVVCGPTALASVEQPTPAHQTFAIDATHVYWTDTKAGTVQKMPLSGGATTTLATDQPGPTSIAVDATSVYWVSGEVFTSSSASSTLYVRKVPLAGGSVETVYSAPESPLLQGFPYTNTVVSLLVNRTHVLLRNAFSTFTDGYGQPVTTSAFPLSGGNSVTLDILEPYALTETTALWVVPWGIRLDYPCADGGDCDSIVRAPLTGGPPETLFSDPANLTALAADASNFYWIQADTCSDAGSQVTCDLGTLKSMPLAGGAPTTLANDVPSAASLTVAGDSVYLLDDGTLARVPISGGSAVPLVTQKPGVGLFTVDSASLYWIQPAPDGVVGGRAKVMRTPLSGGASTVLATLASPGASGFFGLTSDATNLYWGESDGIMKLSLSGVSCRSGACQ